MEAPTEPVAEEDVYDLITSAARAGFAPAYLLQFLYPQEKDDAKALKAAVKSLNMANKLGYGEIQCLTGIFTYATGGISAKKLCEILSRADSGVLAYAGLICRRFMPEAEEASATIAAKNKELSWLRQTMDEERDQHQLQLKEMTSRIGATNRANAELTNQVASLSGSSLNRRTEALQAELETMRKRLADADAETEKTKQAVAAEIADAVKDLREQAEQCRLDRDIAKEELGTVQKEADHLCRMVKRLEAGMRRHGLDPVTCD